LLILGFYRFLVGADSFFSSSSRNLHEEDAASMILKIFSSGIIFDSI
jgi:hypothetical protein